MVAVLVVGLGALAVVLLNSCGGKEAAVDPLAGTQWQVRSYDNPQAGGMASPLAGTQLTASWADGNVNGAAGCNSYVAGYTVDGESLSIKQPAVTMMACDQPPGIMEQEAAFLNALASAKSFKLDSSRLQMLNGTGLVVLDLVPYVPAPEATPTPAAGDTSWERIQAAGKIVVGTSADYPPFESYVGPGQIDGFDIALMDTIGQRLGVTIEYRDIPFAGDADGGDGLGPALLQGQIDAAIAAISRTPEREVYADFSNVYLVSEGAALAQQASEITLTKIDDVAKYKVGVQRNSVYQNQMQTRFIDTGQMSPDNLAAYGNAEDAVSDLKAGRVELVVMDSQPSQAFAEQGGVKVVGIGGSQQCYAIALPKGAAALKAKIDEVITALNNDGTISALSKRYLGTPQLLPTPTPGPTSAPVPTPACTNGLTLVKSLTKEGDMKPGQAFTKGWQVQNSGTCPWTTSYRVVWASGDKMGGEPVAVARQVNAGETYDVQVSLVAPLKAGDYEGVWQMEYAPGKGFGERLKVNIHVLDVPTAVPPPTNTPVPGVMLKVDRENIKAGESVIFTWSAENVKEWYFYDQFERWQDNPGTGNQGSSKEWPQAPSTTYYLRVVYPDNTVHVTEKTIHVEAAPEKPQITRFTVDPPGQITLGQEVAIRWEVEGQVDSARLTANGEELSRATKDTVYHTPAAAGSVTYHLEAVGPGGTSSKEETVMVVEPVEPVTPEPVPEDPVIHAFTVTPNQIQAGDCVNIVWSVGGGAIYANILRDGAVVMNDVNFDGQQSDCLDQPGDHVYQLKAGNVAKEVASDEQWVSVTEAPPEEPLAGTHWMVTALYDGAGNPIPIVADSPPTANFGHGGELNGSAGCNTYSAVYQAVGTTLTIGRVNSSGDICSDPPGIMEQEAAFLEALPAAANFNLQGSRLTILGPTGQKLMELSLLLQ